MKLTESDLDIILCMLDAIEDEWGLSSWELELKEKIERWIDEND